jgi:hypothetical protein
MRCRMRPLKVATCYVMRMVPTAVDKHAISCDRARSELRALAWMDCLVNVV